MIFCLETVKDNGVKSDICSQRGKDPIPSCSSSDSDCASLRDLDTSAVYVPRKMKVWLSNNKLTHASSALAGTCTPITTWWHRILCNSPSATSAARVPTVACSPVLPPQQTCWSGQRCHGRRITVWPWCSVLCSLSCAVSTRCAAAMSNSCARCPPSILRRAERRTDWSFCPILLWMPGSSSPWLNGLSKGLWWDVCQAAICHFSA